MKKILDKSTLQAKLCENPVLVSVEKLQKAVIDITREKVNPQEPYSIIFSVTNVQSSVQMPNITSTKIDPSVKIDIIEKKAEETSTTIGKIGRIDSFVPTTQEQGASQVIMID